VARGFPDLQVGPESVVAVGQDNVGIVKPLGVVVANLKQGHAIGEGIVPENLIHRQLADKVRFGTVFVITLDADDQVTDVIIYPCSANRRREVAMQPHGVLSLV
jgi:hypothetical protein